MQGENDQPAGRSRYSSHFSSGPRLDDAGKPQATLIEPGLTLHGPGSLGPRFQMVTPGHDIYSLGRWGYHCRRRLPEQWQCSLLVALMPLWPRVPGRPPKLHLASLAAQLKADGLSPSEIADRLNVTDRHVRGMRRDLEAFYRDDGPSEPYIEVEDRQAAANRLRADTDQIAAEPREPEDDDLWFAAWLPVDDFAWSADDNDVSSQGQARRLFERWRAESGNRSSA